MEKKKLVCMRGKKKSRVEDNRLKLTIKLGATVMKQEGNK